MIGTRQAVVRTYEAGLKPVESRNGSTRKIGNNVRHIVLLLLFTLIFTLCACSESTGNNVLPDPTSLVQEAALSLTSLQTLRVAIDRTGADYGFDTVIGPVVFNRLTGQYVSPDKVQATARVALAKLPIEIELYTQGDQQWVRGVFSNNEWQNGVFAPGFNPQSLVSQAETGLQGALNALKTLEMKGETQLEDGTQVYEISATADGKSVSSLLVDIVEMTGIVQIAVFIDKGNHRPLKFVVVQPETITDLQPDPTTWTIELYDFDAPPALSPPVQSN